jgi:hypothetical protein
MLNLYMSEMLARQRERDLPADINQRRLVREVQARRYLHRALRRWAVAGRCCRALIGEFFLALQGNEEL